LKIIIFYNLWINLTYRPFKTIKRYFKISKILVGMLGRLINP